MNTSGLTGVVGCHKKKSPAGKRGSLNLWALFKDSTEVCPMKIRYFLRRLKLPPTFTVLYPVSASRPDLSPEEIAIQRETLNRNSRILRAMIAQDENWEAPGYSTASPSPKKELYSGYNEDKLLLDSTTAVGWFPCLRHFIQCSGWRKGILFALQLASRMYFTRTKETP